MRLIGVKDPECNIYSRRFRDREVSNIWGEMGRVYLVYCLYILSQTRIGYG